MSTSTAKTRGRLRNGNSSRKSASNRRDGPRIDFAPLRQPSGKVITAFAVRGDLDLEGAVSNTFTLEWPKGSGNIREYPEIDRVGWFSVAEAATKLVKGQRPLLDRLTAALEGGEPGGSR